MANLNVGELLREVNADGATRKEFYDYLRANDPNFQAIPGEYDARTFFEREMNSGNQIQRRIWAGTWLPEYNRTYRVPNSARADRTSSPSNTKLRNALTKAAGVGVVGLVAIIAGTAIDNETSKTILQAGGSATIAGFIVGVAISYARYR